MTSIRLRFVDWLERIRDDVSKHLVQKLGRSEVHAQTGGNVHNAVVVRVENASAKGQVDHAVVVAGLCQNIDVLNASSGVSNLPEFLANGDLVSTLYHNLVGHFIAPLADHRMVQAKNAGVEPSQ